MQTTTKCRRRQRRHSIAAGAEARVEFHHPFPHGESCSARLVDLSVAGFSFAVPEQLSNLEVGTTVPQAVLRLGSCVMQGDMMIIHVTPERGICGALFYPTTDADLIKLRSVIAGIEAVKGV
jgi:hypothetical protein